MARTKKIQALRAFTNSDDTLLKPSVLRFMFKDFAELAHEPGAVVYSDATDHQGHRWRLKMCPGGKMITTDDDDEEEEDPGISLFLKNLEYTDMFVSYNFLVRNSLGKVHDEGRHEPCTIESQGVSGFDDFLLKRSEILDEENKILVDGALLIDVHLQIKPEQKSIYIPTNPFGTNMLKLLENEEDSDVTFMVKKTKIPAHT